MKICKDPVTSTIPYGMYPLILIPVDGIIICQDCANKAEQECFEGDIYYESSDIECDNCGQMIHSAYGEVSNVENN